MITGDIKNRVDRIWDAFWSGGISNPLEVMEQITYLLSLSVGWTTCTHCKRTSRPGLGSLWNVGFFRWASTQGQNLRGLPLVPLEALRASRDVHRRR